MKNDAKFPITTSQLCECRAGAKW